MSARADISATAPCTFRNSSLDGSSLLIDDDGVGYVAYDAMSAPGMKDHVVAIDRLSPDLYGTSCRVGCSFGHPSGLMSRCGVMECARQS